MMAGSKTAAGDYVKGIEDYIPHSQYEREQHQNMVVQDKQILDLREDEVHGLQVFVQPFHKQAKGLIAGV